MSTSSDDTSLAYATISSENNKGLPRKLTAVGTIGKLNQLFTVYEKNWHCKDCGQENYPSRPKCFRCKKRKPMGDENIVLDPAYEALQSGKEIHWQEVVDPASFQIYYYNKETGVTQWERPVEMGAAPLATGWFGRGQAGSNAAQIYYSKNQQFLSRAARKQKAFIDPKRYHTEGNNEYNIWYGRFIGDMGDKTDREPASDRCVLETDAGFTKADSNNPGHGNNKFFCIHFAHGQCAKGVDCGFFHRIPLPEDDRRCDEMYDCFGRSRHSKHKDDMNGVGSFMKPCRTLFVGNLLKNKYESPKALEETLWKQFGEWGELESLNVIWRLSIAFPRYRLRTSAEFAKEAMTCQALDHGEILSIRWAHDDPNPIAKQAIEQADKDAFVSLLQGKGVSLEPAPFVYPSDYQLPAAKRLRLEEGGDVLEQYPELAYPDTDNQYTSSNSNNSINNNNNMGTDEGYQAYLDTYYAQQAALSRLGMITTVATGSSSREVQQIITSGSEKKDDTVVHAVSTDKVVQEESRALSTAPNGSLSTALNGSLSTAPKGSMPAVEDTCGWLTYTDPSSGRPYYYNAGTGLTTWDQPPELKYNLF